MRLPHALLLGLLVKVACMKVGLDPLAAQQDTVPDEPMLTVRLLPSDPYLQEEIVQVIRLIAPHPFEELVLDLPPVDGAELITLEQPKSRKFETYGGEGFIYETSRAIFPRQSGELRIPPVRVSGSIGINRNEKKAFALREDEKLLKVKPPPASFGEDWWLVASDVTIEETWSKPLEKLRVGDRVTRLIKVTATGATGAHLPDLEQSRSNGLSILPGRIERKTETSVRGVVGTISRSFDIRIDSDRPINLAPIRVVWWNTKDENEQRTVAPAVRLEPLPRDVERLVSDALTEAAIERERSQTGILVIVLGFGFALLAVALGLIKTSRRIRPEDRQLRRDVLENGHAMNAIRALRRWQEASFPNEPLITLEELGKRLGAEADHHLALLQRAAFGREVEPVDAAALALGIVEIAQRRRRQKTSESIARGLDHLLGEKVHLPAVDLKKSGRN